MNRFIRTEQLLGKEAFTLLTTKHVTIVGLGAVGGYVVEGLARAGIGHLTLIDFDRLEVSNINRQLLAQETTLGRHKTEVAAERVLAINSRCEVETMELFCRQENLMQIATPQPDLIVDAIDSLNPKTQLLQMAVEHHIPVISSMGAALRTDPAQITSGDLFSTSGCPLARHVRRRLRRRGITKGIDCVYSTEKIINNFGDQKPEEFTEVGRKRNVLGSLPTIPGIFGLTIANMTILHLAGISPLNKKG